MSHLVTSLNLSLDNVISLPFNKNDYYIMFLCTFLEKESPASCPVDQSLFCLTSDRAMTVLVQ